MCTRCLVKQKEDELSTQKALSAIGEAKMGRGLFFFCIENQLIEVSGVLQASRICHVELNSIEFNVSSTKVGQPIQTLSLIVSWLFSFWICCLRACAVNKKLLFIHYNINVCIWFDEAEIGCLNNVVATFLFDAALSNWTQPVKLLAEIRQVIYVSHFGHVFNQIELSFCMAEVWCLNLALCTNYCITVQSM